MKIGNKFLNNKVLVISIIFVLSLVVTVCFATDKLIKTSNEETNSIFVLPLNKDLEVTYCYGDRVHPITNENITHTGVDLKANQGDEVCSIADGIVVECGYDFRNGNSVKIKHTVSNEEIYSKYNHLSKIDVNLEDNVVAGSKIGEVGSTGMSTGPHLHLEILDENNNYINPSSIFAELK